MSDANDLDMQQAPERRFLFALGVIFRCTFHIYFQLQIVLEWPVNKQANRVLAKAAQIKIFVRLERRAKSILVRFFFLIYDLILEGLIVFLLKTSKSSRNI
jgi:hypothetical protein